MNQRERTKAGNRISKITIFWNVMLSFLKLLAGIIGRSSAMIADGIHSLSDIISTVAVMIGLHMAQKPEDDDHPYGHEKIEPVVAKILATILFITALGIGSDGIHKIKAGTYQTPGMIALYAAILSIIIKEWMYRYTIKGAKKLDSSALLADAWHHRSDVFSSVGTLIAITGARFGYQILDPIASLIISLLIIKVSFEIYKQSINQLVDYAGDKDTIEQIRTDISTVRGVKKINTLKTRVHANKIYVDVAIAVDGKLTVTEGHQIARRVHDKIENNKTYKVKHCMVHVDPYQQVESS
ncbi:cation diffusion facilitator family transporter [Orenia metallireducens]|jgi:cation diffusion facilitator family transporter|uniref:Cation diffusion facilitator family transporter n=1 Tax=Orenia metallireducens TaxID=1413210 RepID=A0A285GQ05_9FIRM|nr:cation diffusion facilitator family transporter [Orenia metallireducens]PRX29917.1 cation diffusion facilitator family transporter [Orenia metallireducens]SNY25649.1 cation diffusion facilitator family transporter [Orenia metallireducens]